MPNDAAATSWSATGAIIAAAQTDLGARRERLIETPYALAMYALTTVVEAGPQIWNDDPRRTQGEVVSALTAALARMNAVFTDDRCDPRPTAPDDERMAQFGGAG
jgi:hypothetical protein